VVDVVVRDRVDRLVGRSRPSPTSSCGR
jgi:hypothetical protein